MEIVTVSITAAGAYLAKDGIGKLLGPTAEYLGNGLKDFTKKRAENIGNIFSKAAAKLGSKIDEPGEVPPKVLKAIIEGGSFVNDELSANYLGGILASSRTETGRDDRGARMANLVDSMSTYQVRTHYFIYATVKKLFSEHGFSMNLSDRERMRIYIPATSYAKAMDYSEKELSLFENLSVHAFFGLHNDGLIESDFRIASKEHMAKIFPGAQESGIICQPSALGCELFLASFGHLDKNLDYIFDKQFQSEIDEFPQGFDGAMPTNLIAKI